MTKEKHEGISNTQNNIPEINTDKQNYNLTNEAIENTPFRMYGNPEEGYCITVANMKITKPAKTIEEAMDKLKYEQWNINANLILILINLAAKEPSFNNNK